ncbi:GAF domain-containing sensor histidine kinase [Desulfofalx alkaliphila]|uniref:GAF domain-containing sensor histidine kinase n=1 Tax=Desulfofalx alkaliphila TaxID=105483 RepID=UPI0004E274B3|nr:GAF domain-containing sensor histidine kinase [Desulfofalx alkaliphila]
MAYRLKAGNNTKVVHGSAQPINIYDLLKPTKNKGYQNELLVKIANLERLSGVKTCSKTHYSELKKSVAEMQRCNLFLTKSQREIENLYQLLKKKAEQTITILEVSRAISNILPFDQILYHTNRLISKMLGTVNCHLYRVELGEQITFTPYIQQYRHSDDIFKMKEEFWNDVIKNKEPVRFSVNNSEFLAMPLVSRGNMLGLLIIERLETGNQFTLEELELCSGIAGPVAVAIENRVLVEELESESSRLKTALLSLKVMSDNLAMLNKGVEPLLQSIGESLLKITDAEYSIVLVNVDDLISVHVPLPLEQKDFLNSYFADLLDKINKNSKSCPYGIHRQNLQEDEKLNFLYRQNGLREMISFPIITRDRLFGLILLFFRAYKEDDCCQSILQILGNQTAIVLENARLFEDILWLKNEAEKHYQLACKQKEQLEEKNRELKNMYNILFRSREEQIISQERNRIAGDLHDNVLQILFGMGLNIKWCLNELDPESPVHSKLLFLEGLANKAIQEIRKVVCEFGTVEATLGLQESIESLAHDLNEAGSVQIEVNINESIPKLPGVVRNITYRIVQEALVNALRHASATQIKINLALKDNCIELRVVDNGVGIPPDTIKNLGRQEGKFGIKNMKQRAKYLSGTLKIKSNEMEGTEVIAMIPVEGVG